MLIVEEHKGSTRTRIHLRFKYNREEEKLSATIVKYRLIRNPLTWDTYHQNLLCNGPLLHVNYRSVRIKRVWCVFKIHWNNLIISRLLKTWNKNYLSQSMVNRPISTNTKVLIWTYSKICATGLHQSLTCTQGQRPINEFPLPTQICFSNHLKNPHLYTLTIYKCHLISTWKQLLLMKKISRSL